MMEADLGSAHKTAVSFVMGNPKLECTTGSLVVWRHLEPARRPTSPRGDADTDFDGVDDPFDRDMPCLVEAEGGAAASSPALPGRVVAVLCVPARFVPTDLLLLLAPFQDHIEAVRLLRHCDDPAQFIALVELATPAHAASLVRSLDGAPFNSLEATPALVAPVHAVAFDVGGNAPAWSVGLPAPPVAAFLASAQLSALAVAADSGALPPSAERAARIVARSPVQAQAQTLAASLAASTDAPPPSGDATPPPGDAAFGDLPVGHPPLQRQGSSDAQCVVCLEALSAHGQAVLTTACGHTFHLTCLRKWSDAPCPVCRYHHNLASVSSHCQWAGDLEHHAASSTGGGGGGGGDVRRCRLATGLLVCLICGFVGCSGRRHGRRHYEASLHAYALEVDSQQVWDFAGEGFVHRLVVGSGDGSDADESGGGRGQSHTGSKLVETSSPAATAAAAEAVANELAVERSRFFGGVGGGGGGGGGTESGGSGGNGSASEAWSEAWSGYGRAAGFVPLSPDRAGAEAAEHRKLEGLSYQFNALLASQLAAQRDHFEEERRQLRRALAGDSGGEAGEPDNPKVLSGLLAKERRALEARLGALRRRRSRVAEELGVTDACNGQLADNVAALGRAEARHAGDGERWAREGEAKAALLRAKVAALMEGLDGASGGDCATHRRTERGGRGEGREDRGGGAAEGAAGSEGQRTEPGEQDDDDDDDEWSVAPVGGGPGPGKKKKKKKGK